MLGNLFGTSSLSAATRNAAPKPPKAVGSRQGGNDVQILAWCSLREFKEKGYIKSQPKKYNRRK